jgi:putative transposase
MGRPLRQAVGGVVYHVLNRRVLRLPLFEDDDDYRAFVGVHGAAMGRDDAPRLFGLCLMPNHGPMRVRPAADGHPPRWQQWPTVAHVRLWQEHPGPSRTVPEYPRRLQRHRVQAEAPLLIEKRYIERNPQRSKQVTRAQDCRGTIQGLQRGTRPTADHRA